MAGSSVVYFLPPASEAGHDDTDLPEEHAPTPRCRTWLARGAAVLVAGALLLSLAAWDSAARGRSASRSVLAQASSASQSPQLWSLDTVLGHLGIPWYDEAVSNQDRKSQLRGDFQSRNSSNATEGVEGHPSNQTQTPPAQSTAQPLAPKDATTSYPTGSSSSSHSSRSGSSSSTSSSSSSSRGPTTQQPGQGNTTLLPTTSAVQSTSTTSEKVVPTSTTTLPPTGAPPVVTPFPDEWPEDSSTPKPRHQATPPPLDACDAPQVAIEGGVPICVDQRSCLCIVDRFLQLQPRNPLGLLQTRAGSLSGGPCGVNCTLPHKHRRCDTYDNALAVIYYVKRGNHAEAKKILDVFAQLLYPFDPTKVDAGIVFDPPSGRKMTLLASAYSNTDKAWAGQYDSDGVRDGTVDTGNNAWAAMAFAHYAAATDSACYSTVARDILYALQASGRCKDDLQGFLGRGPPAAYNFRSSEHNIDVLALARMLGDTDVMLQASHFIRRMYLTEGPFANAYRMGDGACGPSPPYDPTKPVPADAIYWGLLAGADPDRDHVKASLAFALGDSPGGQQPPLPTPVPVPVSPVAPAAAALPDTCCTPGSTLGCCPNNCCAGPGMQPCCRRRLEMARPGLWEQDVDIVWKGSGRPVLNGTRFSTGGHGVQWEVSAGAAMAMVYYGLHYGIDNELYTRRLNEIRNSLRHILAMYKGVPASVLGGNLKAFMAGDHTSQFPGGTDTGISFTYLRYKHVASTAWTGLLMLYQADDNAPVYEDANPFAPPLDRMPSDVDKTCFPWLKQDKTPPVPVVTT